MSDIRLRTRFIILFVGILAISLIIYIVWSNYSQQKQAEREMYEKAYIISQQLDSIWEFMSLNQDTINYDAGGIYNFKGLHCSIVGKSIGLLFSKKTDYIVRYVNYNPRNKVDSPDEFESMALDRFLADTDLKEVYELTDYKGAVAFRYIKPMVINETCLDCHGEPAGELDVLGYPKEGWKIGNLGGVLSIIVPTDLYMSTKQTNMIQEITFFSVLMLGFILVIYIATAKLITNPLKKLTMATEDIKSGKLNTTVDAKNINAQGELKTLTVNFDSMIGELRNVYNDLENKVKLRTQDLAHANTILESQQNQLEEINKRLQTDNEYKSEFLAIMSHELRTPLTSIVAFSEFLEDTAADKLELEQLRGVREIKTNSHVLLSLISNTLEMARLEAGKMDLQFEQVDFVDIINEVKTVIQPLIQKKNLQFKVTIKNYLPIIDGDREKLRRIVENLISNAVKFSNEGGSVDLTVEHDVDNKKLVITVEDKGIGIGKGHLCLIFDKFVQGDSSINRPYNGSGLGLAIARQYTELHGGTIKVESELGKGSIFTVIIPANISRIYTDEDFIS